MTSFQFWTVLTLLCAVSAVQGRILWRLNRIEAAVCALNLWHATKAELKRSPEEIARIQAKVEANASAANTFFASSNEEIARLAQHG